MLQALMTGAWYSEENMETEGKASYSSVYLCCRP